MSNTNVLPLADRLAENSSGEQVSASSSPESGARSLESPFPALQESNSLQNVQANVADLSQQSAGDGESGQVNITDSPQSSVAANENNQVSN